MKTVDATTFRREVPSMIEICQRNGPIRVVSDSGTSIMMSEDIYESLIETIAVLSDPLTARSIASDESLSDGMEWSEWKASNIG